MADLNEQSREAVILLIQDKLDNLIETVHEIKDSITNTSSQVAAMKIDINTLQNKTEQQQKEIDKLYEKNGRNQGWIMTVGATVVASIVVAVLRLVFGT